MAKFIEAKTCKEAQALAPDAAKIVKVDGGYMAFDTIQEYRTWEAQK